MELCLLVAILILALMGSFALGRLLPRIKGWFGEAAVAGILSGLPTEEYKVLNNVMLQTETGTTQIDHIVVSVYGIFVIEMKNYKGWITGDEYSEEWTKHMYGKKYKFRNPLKQNYGHVKTLESLLGLPEDKFIPIVAFSVDSDIKVKPSKPVVYTVQLKKEIKSHQEKMFELSELPGLVEKITDHNVDSRQMRQEHEEHIKEKVRKKERSIAEGVCPRCGGALVRRKGKYGEFTGCRNYPKCHYTVK